MSPPGNTEYIMVFTTLPSLAAARTLVQRLVERRIAACGTILPGATSLYWWEGRVEEAGEVQVLFKTRRDRWGELQEAVREHHPYDVPELLAIPVAQGLPAYLDWVGREAAGAAGVEGGGP